VRIAIADEQTVLAAEANPSTPPHPAWRRIFPLDCFPGAAVDLPSGATVLRGTVVRTDDHGVLVPARWIRVRATTPTGAEVGWAHGDDRGEFVLVATHPEGEVALPADPLLVLLTIGALLPPTQPDALDPLLAEVDPLWDLPLEVAVASPNPTGEPTLTGRRFLPEHTQLSPLNPASPIALPHGRQTSVVIRIT
jgi:hypothetical protein